MARRKIADLAGLKAASDGLEDLTPHQFAFVKGLLDGKSASDAYRAAYDCSNMLPESIWALASRLRADVKVASWLSAARQAELGTAKITLDQHVQRLAALKDIAVKTGNVGAAVQAEQIIGKVLGYHVERIQDITEDNPLATLERIKQHAPELAHRLAEANGIALDPDTKH